jgi:hypothetical protein
MDDSSNCDDFVALDIAAMGNDRDKVLTSSKKQVPIADNHNPNQPITRNNQKQVQSAREMQTTKNDHITAININTNRNDNYANNIQPPNTLNQNNNPT